MIDRDELAPEARAQLQSARAALSPDDVAIRRVRARIGAAIAAGAVVATVDAGAHAAATSAAPVAATSIAAKLTAVVLAIGVAAGTGAVVVARRAGSVAVRAPIIAPSPSTEHEVVTDVPAALPAHEEPAAPPSAPIAEPRHAAPPAPAPVAAPIAAVVPIAPVVPAPPPIASLARETELIDAASRALAHDQPDLALAAIARFTVETAGHGQLAEDAAAIEIEARCKLGDARTAEALAAFDARWPRSLEHARLVAACGKVIE